MPIEKENGSARRADWSATRQAPAYARNEETRVSGKGRKDAPERQALPASSGARMQGGWKEGSRGDLRLAEMIRARGPHSFGGLFEDGDQLRKPLQRHAFDITLCGAGNHAQPVRSRDRTPAPHGLRRDVRDTDVTRESAQ